MARSAVPPVPSWRTTWFSPDTKNKETEILFAPDRKTGKERWRAEWQGAMTIPLFAASNGSWIRSTSACDGERLYVGRFGMP